MIHLTHPNPISEDDLALRAIATQVALSGQTPPKRERPPGLPTVSLMFLLKNEWMTAEEVVARTIPFVTEIIIGIDKETDSIKAFAFAEAAARKTQRECLDFFGDPKHIENEVTYEELCEWLGVDPDVFALELRDKYLVDGKPTVRAAERCLAMVGKGKILDIDFNDHFSNARNKLLEHCTGDFVFIVDGHEYLSDVWKLIRVFQQAEIEVPGFLRMGILVDMQDSPAKEANLQTRIFRRTPDAHYERGVHNQLVIGGEKSFLEPSTWDVRLIHQRPAFLQYLRVPQRTKMTTTYMGTVDDHHDAYYMATNAHKCERWEDALTWYKRYLELNPEGIEAAYVCAMIASIYIDKLGMPEKSDQYYKKGIYCSPQASFCYLGLSENFIRRGDDLEGQAGKKELQEEYYKTGLLYAQQSMTCEMPKSTIALPQTAYTFEPKIRLAESYVRLGNPHLGVYWYGEAIKQIPEGDSLIEELEDRLREVASVNYQIKDRQRREAGRKILYIVDALGQFNDQVAKIAEELGYEVIVEKTANTNTFMACDICWCDWLDQDAANLSRLYKGDRRLIVRCHSIETFSGIHGTPPAILNWDNVDVLAASSNLIRDKLVRKFGAPMGKIRIIPVVPDPDRFSEIQISPENQDVVILKRMNYKSGLEFLPEIALRTPDINYHVGGTVQDERLYDHLVYQCCKLNLSNIRIYGHIEPFEIGQHFSRGSRFLQLSPWEGTPVAVLEAQAAGLQVFALDAEWVIQMEGMVVAPTINSLAEALMTVRYERYPIKKLREKYHDTCREVRNAITG